MRRVVRHSFTLCSPLSLSLLLCVAACVLWVRSHSTCDMFHVPTATRLSEARLAHGSVWLGDMAQRWLGEMAQRSQLCNNLAASRSGRLPR